MPLDAHIPSFLIVQTVMHGPPVTIDPTATVQEAARVMRHRSIDYIIALRDGVPTGIVTERDLMDLIAQGHDPTRVRVQDIMSTPVITVPAAAQIGVAAERMRAKRIKRLAVVVGTELRGMVTAQDIAYALPEAERRFIDALRQRWVD